MKRLGLRPPVMPWTDEQRAKHARTKRLKALGKTYIEYRRGIPYRTVMTLTGRRYEHRVVMEQHLGRPLARSEVVHHINHDSLDNRIENLQVLTWSDHNRTHASTRKFDPTIGKLPEGQWSRKHAHCVGCGTTERPHICRGLCGACRQRELRHGRFTERV